MAEYDTDFDLGIAGQLADLSGRKHVDSKVSEEATSFPYGVACVAGSASNGAVLPTGAASLLGVVLHRHKQPSTANSNTVDDEDVINVLREGRCLVLVEEAVTPASTVYVRISTGAGGSQKGAFRASADTATALAASGMRYVSSASSGGLAILEVDAGAAIA